MNIHVYHHWPKLEVVHSFDKPLTVIVKEDKPVLKGGMFMYIVKDDNKDVGYVVNPGVVTDSEGVVIPDAQVTVEVVSDAPGVVEVIPGPDGKTGTVHFGAPGVASLNALVKLGEVILGSFGAQFTVTVGDPAAISGGTISFEGLTEAPVPPIP
jgi:hypothetical protein